MEPLGSELHVPWHHRAGEDGVVSASHSHLSWSAGSVLLLPIKQGDVSILCGDSSIFTWQSEAAGYSHHLMLLHCSHPTSLS